MVTMTRELERGLIEAGVPAEQAERIAVGLDERLSEVATKQDVEGVREEVRELKRDIERQIDKMERTMWRLAWLGFAMWSATFGALMYAVFG